MTASFSFNPAQGKFPQSGNKIGEFICRGKSMPIEVHCPTKLRTKEHLKVRGNGEALDSWVLWQMKQDIDRGDGILCFDPQGKYAVDIVAMAGKENAKRIVWIDLGDDERYIPFNPCDPLGQGLDSDFYEWREFLFSQLEPLSAQSLECLNFGLRTLHFNLIDNVDTNLNLVNLLKFLQSEDYRRYIFSHQNFMMSNAPSAEMFEQAFAGHSQRNVHKQ